MKQNKWFSVKVFFKYYMIDAKKEFNIVNHDYKYQYEEIVYLVSANSFDDAINKGEKLAHDYEKELINVDSEKVIIKFTGILDSFCLFVEELNDGAELYSRIFFMEEEKFEKVIDDVFAETQ